MNKKITVKDFRAMKGSGRKIAMLTAYDASLARLLERAGVEVLLVGDSLGMVVLGYESTVPVRMEEMLHHTGAVCRGTQRALVIADMPFGSYQVSSEQAVHNGLRFLKETGCAAVKVEGGEEVCARVQALVQAGVPVMGHIGLTPQTAGQLGGFKVQGKDLTAARQLLRAAKALDQAGVFGLVLEAVPAPLARVLTASVSVPTIGIGAGPDCDGQILVTNDLLGLFDQFTPRFVKRYLQLGTAISQAVQSYIHEVEAGVFPDAEHSFASDQDLSLLLRDES
jgi:3-methyl-2-oxobutanoate hydroxymethyltransferase